MRGLSLTILVLLLYFNIVPQEKDSDSPHGENFNVSCNECHNSESWKINMATFNFDHNSKTKFALEGLHIDVDCKSCHDNLKFLPTESECASCHTDVHEQTVGFECERCHTSNSWMVENITQIHQLSRFPLLGAHNTADCNDCHTTASTLRFDPLDTDCYSCHQADYNSTTSPNHVQSNYSTDCTECHQMNAFGWTGSDINHAFFPLVEGHDIADCSQCHQDPNDYGNISADCISCHQNDYNSATSPDHAGSGFSTDCTICHSLAPGWKPADFSEHDVVFPIYSGEHNGEWNSCTECHPVTNNYSIFTCTGCHEHNQSEMNEEHNEIDGYIYDSQACLECHPTGSEEGAFNHSNSAFPLTGAHIDIECSSCHVNGYEGTTTVCFECHTTDFNSSANPNHLNLGLGTNCEDCHSTEPDWQPASFDIHNEFYQLNGAHNTIANDCFECHNGDYNNTPNTCYLCHTEDYNQTIDPPHASAQFSTDCLLCHTETVWDPSTFDHDSQYFPIYSGEHRNEWNTCSECHTNAGNYAVFSCIDCHEHNESEMNGEHNDVSDYIYESNACLDCHPNGSEDMIFHPIKIDR